MAEKEYIERDAALEALKYYYGCSVEVECDQDCIVTECAEGRIIRALPAADVVPVVHAEWERNANRRICTICGFVYYDNGGAFNFCPNCGARMDGGKHG